jgi:hypothetical protein
MYITTDAVFKIRNFSCQAHRSLADPDNSCRYEVRPSFSSSDLGAWYTKLYVPRHPNTRTKVTLTLGMAAIIFTQWC